MNDLERRRRQAESLRGMRERRTCDASLEFRGGARSGGLGASGYAAVFNTPTTIRDFTEVIRPSAFRRSLGNSPDVVLVVQHGDALSGLPIARTTAGTLRLSTDDIGLKFEADLDPEDDDVRMLQRKFSRGDLDGQMSFCFRVPDGGQKWSDDFRHRELTTIELNGGDCSFVTFGAYQSTSSQLMPRSAKPAVPRIDATALNTRDRERLARLGIVARTPPLAIVPSAGVLRPSTEQLRREAAVLERRDADHRRKHEKRN
jgi:HK97 family phage prohead protease